ncbi:Ig-like domain repeat protein [Myxococcaceae bacterium JPH2]|nr:Ig-like domain repeat protein [Myxococcaceae bacterium JPH2]
MMGNQVLSTVALQGRQARHTVTGLQPGHSAFTSIYSGDTRFGGSVSPTVEMEVLKKAPAAPGVPSTTQDKGCGCNESGASGGVALLLLGALLGRRRHAA